MRIIAMPMHQGALLCVRIASSIELAHKPGSCPDVSLSEQAEQTLKCANRRQEDTLSWFLRRNRDNAYEPYVCSSIHVDAVEATNVCRADVPNIGATFALVAAQLSLRAAWMSTLQRGSLRPEEAHGTSLILKKVSLMTVSPSVNGQKGRRIGSITRAVRHAHGRRA